MLEMKELLHEESYRRIPIITPGLIFVRKVFFSGFISQRLIFGDAYYRSREFCASKWVWFNNKKSFKHYYTSLKQLTLTVYGLIFGRAHYQKDICV